MRQKTFSGFVWTALGIVGNGLVSVVVTMILARLLMPEDFALIELLTIFIAVSNVFIDSGFSQAVIRDSSPSQTDLSTVFFFNFGIALLIYVLLFFAAPYIAGYFNAPRLTSISRCAFLVIIFNSLGIIQNANFNRQLNFRAQATSNVIGVAGAGVVSVSMAFGGAGIWALVANMTLYPLFRSIVLWVQSSWRPSLVVSFQSVKRYFSFGGFLLLQGLIDSITTNLVSAITGKVYTQSDLGYMSQGRKLDNYIVGPVNSIINKVTYPVLAKIKDTPGRLKEGTRQVIRSITFAYIPLMLFVIFSADNIIITLFGAKWEPAGIYLAISAVGGLLLPMQHILLNATLAKGKSKASLICAIAKQTIRVVALLLFIHVSVVALFWAFSVSTLIGSCIFMAMGMYYMRYSLWEFVADLSRTGIISVASVLAVWAVGRLLNVGAVPTFFVQVAVMAVLYFGLSYLFNRKELEGMLDLFRPMLKKVANR